MSSENVSQFIALTSTSQSVAEEYLQLYNDDIGDALNAYYADQAEAKTKLPQSSRSNPQSQSKGSKPTSANRDTKFMSLSQMLKGQSDDDDDEGRNTFAGGEKSGLEVTDPNDSNSLIKDLLEKAKRGGQELLGNDEDSENKINNFTGKGYRLGATVDTESQVVEDNSAPVESPKRVTRDITFWKEGFQVGDSELFRYDDPANSFYLNELNQGRAPLKLLNVEFGQEVDVNVYKKLDESYQAPKRKLGGFSGKGQRLGSPIPGDTPEAPAVVNENQTVKAEKPQEKKAEEKRGNSSVQIRYATGKREIYCCKETDTVQDLYDYVKSNTNDSRSFTLNNSFPVTPIENFDDSLKDANLINSVVVQRWV